MFFKFEHFHALINGFITAQTAFCHCAFSIYHCTFCASLRIKKCPALSPNKGNVTTEKYCSTRSAEHLEYRHYTCENYWASARAHTVSGITTCRWLHAVRTYATLHAVSKVYSTQYTDYSLIIIWVLRVAYRLERFQFFELSVAPSLPIPTQECRDLWYSNITWLYSAYC